MFTAIGTANVVESRDVVCTFLQVRESKAFYSLGNVYHSKGKDAANGLQLDPGQYPVSVREALQNAACFYE